MSIVKKEDIDYRILNDIERASYYNRFVLNSGATKTFMPSFVVLEFQRFLMAYYSNPKDHFKFNKRNGKEVDTELLIDVHHFVMTYGLPAKGGENLVEMIMRNLNRFVSDDTLMPDVPQYRAIRKAFNKNLDILYKLKIHNFELPPQFFGVKYRVKNLELARVYIST